MSIATESLTLEAFLALPETKPASEFINGQIIQKPMPQGEHARLQSKLSAITKRAKALKLPTLLQSYGALLVAAPLFQTSQSCDGIIFLVSHQDELPTVL
jgi:hypothetical protein